jgi:hypothetical protein
MSIIEKLGIVYGSLKIRKCIDDSGDCERSTYDILNCFEWGSSLITSDIDNPKHARLFAVAPEMLKALIEYADNGTFNTQEQHYNIISIIEKATDMKWEEIKELIE